MQTTCSLMHCRYYLHYQFIGVIVDCIFEGSAIPVFDSLLPLYCCWWLRFCYSVVFVRLIVTYVAVVVILLFLLFFYRWLLFNTMCCSIPGVGDPTLIMVFHSSDTFTVITDHRQIFDAIPVITVDIHPYAFTLFTCRFRLQCVGAVPATLITHLRLVEPAVRCYVGMRWLVASRHYLRCGIPACQGDWFRSRSRCSAFDHSVDYRCIMFAVYSVARLDDFALRLPAGGVYLIYYTCPCLVIPHYRDCRYRIRWAILRVAWCLLWWYSAFVVRYCPGRFESVVVVCSPVVTDCWIHSPRLVHSAVFVDTFYLVVWYADSCHWSFFGILMPSAVRCCFVVDDDSGLIPAMPFGTVVVDTTLPLRCCSILDTVMVVIWCRCCCCSVAVRWGNYGDLLLGLFGGWLFHDSYIDPECPFHWSVPYSTGIVRSLCMHCSLLWYVLIAVVLFYILLFLRLLRWDILHFYICIWFIIHTRPRSPSIPPPILWPHTAPHARDYQWMYWPGTRPLHDSRWYCCRSYWCAVHQPTVVPSTTI